MQFKISSVTAQLFYTVVEAGSVDEKTSTQAFGSGPFPALIRNTLMSSWLNQVKGCASNP